MRKTKASSEKGFKKQMNWKQFLKVAYPENLAIEESHKDIIFRSHRWIGLRFAYIFYQLGMSGNFISISRMLISLISFYLISLVVKGSVWLPLTGAFLLYGQNILDYSDGAVARASGKASKLGKELEESVNAYSRGVILVLISVFTKNVFVVVATAFSSFILIDFRVGLRNKILHNIKFVKLFYRIVLSIQFMLFILPLLAVLNNILKWHIVIFSYIVAGFYALLAILWFFLCIWRKDN